MTEASLYEEIKGPDSFFAANYYFRWLSCLAHQLTEHKIKAKPYITPIEVIYRLLWVELYSMGGEVLPQNTWVAKVSGIL